MKKAEEKKYSKWARKLRFFRENRARLGQRGLTKELNEKGLRLVVPDTYIHKYEYGKLSPTREMSFGLAQAFFKIGWISFDEAEEWVNSAGFIIRHDEDTDEYKQWFDVERPRHPPSAIIENEPPTKDSSFIGRKEELALLGTAWEEAQQRNAQLVVISGESGIGKTRLAEELLMSAQRQGYTTARARTYSLEVPLAYGPVADWLRTATLHPQLSQLNQVWLSEVARLLPELLVEHPDLPPPQPLTQPWQRKRLFEALVQAFTRSQRPLLLLLDDLQWCDPETLEWVQYLLGASPQAKLLLVGTVRSEEVDADHPLHKLWRALTRVGKLKTIQLEPLTVKETAMLGAQVAQQVLDAEAAEWLYRETEGNPLFIVELVQTGRVEEQGSSLPPTVQAVIATRLAQLSESAHQLAQLAATVGRAFTSKVLLAAASDTSEDALVKGLDELWQRRIVRKLSEHDYDFSHHKIRDVAYDQITPMRRPLLHRRVAEALEQVYATTLDIVSDQLAHHYEVAGNLNDAVFYYHKASTVAKRRSAYSGAIVHLEKALKLLYHLPDTDERGQQELVLLIDQAFATVSLRGYAADEALQIYKKARQLSIRLRAISSQFSVSLGLAACYMVQAELKSATDLGKECLSLAEQVQDPGLLLESHALIGTTKFYLGNFKEAICHLEKGNQIYDLSQHRSHSMEYTQDPRVVCLSFSGLAHWFIGSPEQALDKTRAALDHANVLAHPYSLALAQFAMCWIYLLRKEWNVAHQWAKNLIELSAKNEFSFWWILGRMFSERATSGDIEAEKEPFQLEQSIKIYNATDAKLALPFWRAMSSEMFQKAGLIEEGLKNLRDALEQRHEDSFYDAELYRLKGELLSTRSAEVQAEEDFHQAIKTAQVQAEEDFRQAIKTAQKQGSKSLELRGVISLCRLWQQQEGKAVQAREWLDPIYSWFTEGVDTVDLIEARDLLKSLGGSESF